MAQPPKTSERSDFLVSNLIVFFFSLPEFFLGGFAISSLFFLTSSIISILYTGDIIAPSQPPTPERAGCKVLITMFTHTGGQLACMHVDRKNREWRYKNTIKKNIMKRERNVREGKGGGGKEKLLVKMPIAVARAW